MDMVISSFSLLFIQSYYDFFLICHFKISFDYFLVNYLLQKEPQKLLVNYIFDIFDDFSKARKIHITF